MASGAARRWGQDPKECGHPWHAVSQVPQQGGGILAAGDGAAATTGALPGVRGSSGTAGLRLLPVAPGSPPGQGGRPRQACRHLPAMGGGKGRMQPRVGEHRGPAQCPAHPGAGTKPSQRPSAPTFGPGKPGCPGLPTSPCKERGVGGIPTGCLQASYMDGARRVWKGCSPSSPAVPAHPASNKGTVSIGGWQGTRRQGISQDGEEGRGRNGPTRGPSGPGGPGVNDSPEPSMSP